MALFDEVADLPLTLERYELVGLERDVSSAFTRLTTLVHLHGGGHEGIGEDVVYDALDHIAFQDAGPVLDFSSARTFGEFCELTHSFDLFPSEPVRPVSRLYRRWSFESAALDLALRQAQVPLHEWLGIGPRPAELVVSLRLGGSPPNGPFLTRADFHPSLRFEPGATEDRL